MDSIHPRSWDEAVAAKAERPDAVPISGGTELMVDINFDRRRLDTPPKQMQMRVLELVDPNAPYGLRAAGGCALTRVPVRPEHFTGT